MSNIAPISEVAPQKPSRRWLRFSLRTMLIAVALLCVWLAIVCQNAARQKHATEVIESAGGYFTYLSGDKDYPYIERREARDRLGWLRNLIGFDFFETVGEVDFWERDDSPRVHHAIAALGDLPHLRALHIRSAKITDDEMAIIQRLPLHQLTFESCTLTPAGWKSVCRMTNLRILGLYGQEINDAVLENIGAETKIIRLELSGVSVTDAGLTRVNQMPELREVRLIGNIQLTSAGVARFEKANPGIDFTIHPPSETPSY